MASETCLGEVIQLLLKEETTDALGQLDTNHACMSAVGCAEGIIHCKCRMQTCRSGCNHSARITANQQ